ncbi:hypothetical protein FKM82_018824 [Ascaphus truei]
MASSNIFQNRNNRHLNLDTYFKDANLSFKEDQEQINATCIKLERKMIKDTKKWIDLLFLKKYVEYKIIPRGLRVQKIRPWT